MVAAFGSPREGWFVLWIRLLPGFSSLALRLSNTRLREVTPSAQAVLLGFAAFSAVLLLGFANPFQPRSPVPAEGTGLNPLLRHPMMAIHPVMLYSGYTLAAVPFAFAIGALVARRLGADWIAAIRRFSLAALPCLGVGIP